MKRTSPSAMPVGFLPTVGLRANRRAGHLTGLISLALGMCAASAHAVEPQHEYRKYIESAQTLTALTDALMGDSVSLYNGSTEFLATDISIPGNSALPVELSRRLSIELLPVGPDPSYDASLRGVGNWEIDVPSLSGTFDAQYGWRSDTPSGLTDQRCSVSVSPAVHAPFAVSDVYQGVTAHLPGQGDRKLIKADSALATPVDGKSYRWTTRERDALSCIPMKSGMSGEGFQLVTRDGIRYDFDIAIAKTASVLSRSNGQARVQAARVKYYLLASRISDRFGNTVVYQYNAQGHPVSVTSSDDGGSPRTISLSYNAEKLASATANGRTWQYRYNASGELETVIQPDQAQWNYSYEGTLRPPFQLSDGAGCDADGPLPANYAVSVTHPSGAVGRFELSNRRHYRAGVQKSECVLHNSGGQLYYTLNTPNFYDVMSLDRKLLSGPGLSTQQWTYNYGVKSQPLWGSGQPVAYPCTTCEVSKNVTVVEPDGSRRLYSYGILYTVNDGKLLETQVQQSDGTVLRSETQDYLSDADAASVGFLGTLGVNTFRDDPSAAQLRPVVRTTITQDGASFINEVARACNGVPCFDAFANPTQIKRYSSVTPQLGRTEEIGYHYRLADWVLGQKAVVTCRGPAGCNGLEMERTDFDPKTALPIKTYAFGRTLQSLTYSTKGTLSALSDAKGNTTTIDGWKRGLPIRIRMPATVDQPSPVSISATIDGNGWITDATNEAGAKTCYAYDGMGRITRITFPSASTAGACDQSGWRPVSQAFEQVNGTEYGIPAGHWRSTRSVGGLREITYLDAFWRPLVAERLDSGATGSRTVTVTRYDLAGHTAFTSYPMENVGGFNDTLDGIATNYDALGRPRRVSQSSEIGTLPTVIEYLAGFTQRVTDPRGFKTTTSYLAWDTPITDLPTRLIQPENVTTEITRDAFGKPLAIRRGDQQGVVSLTRRYVYDGLQQLCKQIDPESGASIMQYDVNGNLAWSASGQPLTSTQTCDQNAVPNQARIIRGYDARNRLLTLQFPDGLGDTVNYYTPDSLLASAQTLNSEGLQVNRLFDYDNKRNLISERLQAGTIDWTLRYGFDALGSLSSVTQPDGLVIDYAPNALGQATRAGAYALGVSYFPNGAIRSFTYGNGLSHTLTQNTRQLPERSLDGGGALDDTYDYDQNGNVVAISDGLSGQRGNRDMRYDGLNRLTQTLSPMFPGGTLYHYDVLDNLTSLKSPGRDYVYSYDQNWRLTLVSNAASGAGVLGLGYDDYGNLANRNGVLYRFDLGNRLREAVGKERYAYDDQGRRVRAIDVASAGAIYSLYGRDGVLRYQLDQRKGQATSYVYLGKSLVAKVSDVVAPPIPQLTVPAFANSGSYTVSWSSVAGAARYELEEQTNGGGFVNVYSGLATSQALSSKGSGVYGYRVRACNRTTCGTWSAVASVSVTLAPSQAPSLNAPDSAIGGSYALSWSGVAGAQRYELNESADGVNWSALYDGPAASYTVSSRPSGTFRYQVRGCNETGCGPWSATATVQSIVAPTSAPALSVPGSSSGTYGVSWSGVATATGYVLEESANGGAWAAFGQTAGTSMALTRETGSYQYRVKACNAGGCGPTSATAGISVLTAPRAAPALSAPATSNSGSYTVSWSGVATATGYQLEQRLNGGAWSTLFAGARSSWTVAVGAGHYDYQVKACNGSGCGPYSALASVDVTLPPATPRITYNHKSQTAKTPIRINCVIQWTAVANATTYELLTDGVAVRYSGPATQVGSSNQTYSGNYHQVRACNSAGCSPWSTPPTPQEVEIVSNE